MSEDTRTRSRPNGGGRGDFMSAYLAGTPRAVPRPRLTGAGLTELAAPPVGAAPADSIALGGHLLTSEGPVRGWVTIEGGLVTRVATTKPSGPKAVQTEGIILPGLIDLHGHPEFNVFAAWEPPRSYVNRYSWRDSTEYKNLIRDPQNRLLTALPSGTQLRYAEIRALVGGVTAIQGASGRTQGADEFLVRNVDRNIFGEHRARTMIDLPDSLTGWGGDDLQAILAGITVGEVTAFYLHLAEGQRTNQRSIDEFDHLVDLGALTKATVIIHGTALTRDQLGQAAAAGAKLVWSPQSNLRLYGETTRIADALDVGLPVGLGADWLPSGSTSLLAELKVARQQLANQHHPLPAADLVHMVTAGAADIAGLGDLLGSLQVGRPADLLVLARRHLDPYESVCASTANDVQLVLIGGNLCYGHADWIPALAQDPFTPNLEPVLAWGQPMLLDTSYQAQPNGEETPRLAQLRAALTGTYPPVGPIWA